MSEMKWDDQAAPLAELASGDGLDAYMLSQSSEKYVLVASGPPPLSIRGL